MSSQLSRTVCARTPSPANPRLGSSNVEVVSFTGTSSASATHRLTVAFTAVALVTTSSSLLLAQATGTPAQEPASPAPPPVFLLDNKPPPTSRFTFGPESWLSDVEVKCIGCPGGAAIAGPESTNRNAPWLLQGKWQRETSFGVASVGFAGIRNSAVPALTALPLGGDAGQATLGSSTSLFMPSTQWSVNAGLEKTLVKRSNGATIGVLTDLIVPVQTKSAVAGDPRLSRMKSAALRFGVVFRW